MLLAVHLHQYLRVDVWSEFRLLFLFEVALEVRLVLIRVVERSIGLSDLDHVLWWIHHFVADPAFSKQIFEMVVCTLKWVDEILGFLFVDSFVAFVDWAVVIYAWILIEGWVLAGQSFGHNKFSNKLYNHNLYSIWILILKTVAINRGSLLENNCMIMHSLIYAGSKPKILKS